MRICKRCGGKIEDMRTNSAKYCISCSSKDDRLENFVHPKRCIYLLGKEDGNLSKKAIEHCQHLVEFTSKHCLNVASAGTVVLYDRQTKLKV